MRSGSLDVSRALTTEAPMDQVEALLADVIAASRAAGNTGDYRVIRLPNAFHVVPTAARDGSGMMSPFTPLLDTRIAIEPVEGNIYELFDKISEAVRARTGRPFRAGTPGASNLFIQRRARIEARDEPARDVFWRMLDGLDADLCWSLLCSAGDTSCYLNVHQVRTK